MRWPPSDSCSLQQDYWCALPCVQRTPNVQVLLVDGAAPTEAPASLAASVAPPVRLEVVHAQDEPSTGPPATTAHTIQCAGSIATPPGAGAAAHTCTYQCSSTHRFKHKKGADLATRLLDTQVRRAAAYLATRDERCGAGVHMAAAGQCTYT
jgi:hypothetical protein